MKSKSDIQSLSECPLPKLAYFQGKVAIKFKGLGLTSGRVCFGAALAFPLTASMCFISKSRLVVYC